MLYFDHAASTPLCSEALETLQKSMKEDFANPSAAHKWGKELSQKTESIREDFLKKLKAPKESRFVFTGSASESNNTVIKGLGLLPGDIVFVSLGDHASLVKPALALEEQGVIIKELPLNEVGAPCLDLFPAELDAKTKLILVSSVNSQSGGILNVEEFSAGLKKRIPQVHLHVDAVQSFGKLPLALDSKNIDSIAVSAHKMGGPKGVAGLWLNKGVSLKPLLHGGNQETDIRSSTIAFPMIASFHRAYEVAEKNRVEALDNARALRGRIINGLNEIAPELELPFELSKCSPYIISILWKGISSDIVLRHLEQKGVAIASTSACSSKIKGNNPTMKALGLPADVHKFVLRVSIGKSTTEEEVLSFLTLFKEVYGELKMFVKR